MTTLIKDQKKTQEKFFTKDGVKYHIMAKICHDDECGNGHNTFSITGDIKRQNGNGRWVEECGGCIHRDAAIWPDATDAELCAPDLKERLIVRLPALIADFRRDVESLGFTF